MSSNFLMKAAVTGGLSCGKSTVCQFFKDLGAYTISADAIVHELLVPTTEIGRQVVALFGSEILVDGQHGEKKIERAKIAEKAFQQPNLLRSLENLLHPTVHEEMEKQYQYAVSLSYPLFVAEIPLLFEIGAESFYDVTIAVVASQASCIERFNKVTGQGADEYFRRMARQLNPQLKAAKASYVIDNDRSAKETRAIVAKIYAEMLSNHPKGV